MTDGEQTLDNMAREAVRKAVAFGGTGLGTAQYKTRSGQQIEVRANWDTDECAIRMEITVNGAACAASMAAHLIDVHIRSL